MGKIDWEVVTNYVDAVTTSLKTVTFPKVQDKVYLRNQGNANLTYTIGSQSGTLTPGQSVTVKENISSFTLQAATGTHTFELRANEAGTEVNETIAEANHTHANKEVLDQLSDNSGVLQYKGSPIQSGSGGGGSLVYATLSALQTAYPGGTTQPAWVIADNSWYYWSGTVSTPDATPPNNVTGVNATSVTQTSMTIGWTAVSDAVSYEVWRDSSLVSTVSTNSYNATGLTAGTSYSWVIKAKDAAGNTASGSTPLVQSTQAAGSPDTTAPVLTITPAATFSDTQTVNMSTNETATIWYTLDDTDPTSSGTKIQYTAPLTLTATDTIKAYAVDSANNASAVQTVTYTKQAASTGYYLAFDGSTSLMTVPVPAGATKFTMKMAKKGSPTSGYMFDFRGSNSVYLDGTAAGYTDFKVNGVSKTPSYNNGTSDLPSNTVVDVEVVLTSATVSGTGTIGMRYTGTTATDHYPMDLYDLKFYDASSNVIQSFTFSGSGTTLTGTAGNGTLTNTTWVAY